MITHRQPRQIAIASTSLAVFLAMPMVNAASNSEFPPISISPFVPNDINGGAANATLAQAAAFAWQEFIALSWPAKTEVAGKPQRDTPDLAQVFGSTAAGPLVWQTFRNKVEIFPGINAPHGYSAGPPNYGYDQSPKYIYSKPVPPCSLSSKGPTPWVNLDENSQIGLDKIYAGVAAGNAHKGEILFLAKANRAAYIYDASNKLYDNNIKKQLIKATATYVAANQESPPAGSNKYVSFNYGTIEIKSAWRKLTPQETASKRFHVNRVRVYESDPSAPLNRCYRNDEWGLLGLHIIHKTPSAPYFIFATFGQADNMLTNESQPVEDVNGNLLYNKGIPALNPVVTSKDAVGANPATVKSIQKVSLDGPNCIPGPQLHYSNIPNAGLPTEKICVQNRIHAIPESIISVNQAAHKAISDYNANHNLADSVWNYYKLVNVQYKPLTKLIPGQPYDGPDVASYYQANIVIETDYNLQVFSGQFQHGSIPASANLITDFNLNGTPFYNVKTNRQQYNMGGCMGCHGNAQQKGADFSFILLFGRVGKPDKIGN